MQKEQQSGESSPHGSRDVISNLPEEIINLIFVHLPIKDAVKTCILSKMWRYKWVSITDLVFDRICFNERKDLFGSMTNANIVDHVLLHHVGPIRKFSLDLAMPCSSIDQYNSHINRWIVFLSRNGIKELLLLSYNPLGRTCLVPNSLFYCQELCYLQLMGLTLTVPSAFQGLQSLQALQLNNCTLKISPAFEGFRSLTDLNLQDDVTLDDGGGDLTCLISKCPVLERLTIRTYCPWPLKIHAPNLRYLDIKGEYLDLSLLCPLLADVSIASKINYNHNMRLMEGESCNWISVLAYLHGIQRLVMSNEFLKCSFLGSVPEKLSTTYYHLKYLRVDIDFRFDKEIFATLCICKSSPNLEELHIRSYFNHWNPDLMNKEGAWLWDGQELNYLFERLKIVGMSGIYGIVSELKLMRYLLANSPMLLVMRIKIDRNLKGWNVESRKQRIFRNLMQFRRASAQAQIMYLGV